MTKWQAAGIAILLAAIAWNLSDIAVALRVLSLHSRDARLDLRGLADTIDAMKKKGAAASAEVPPLS